MDRIAVISDIHGNLPALEAVLKDIENRNISRIFCLGDIIGRGPDSARAVDLCKEKCDVILKGNWDESIANTEGPEWTFWYKNQIGEKRLQFLKSQNFAEEFFMSGNLIRLFHSHPHDVFKRIFLSSSKEDILGMFDVPTLEDRRFENKSSDIVGYADIHQAFIKSYDNGILFNTGSVGNPLDIPLSSYVILEGNYNSRVKGSVGIQFVRVPYDIDRAVSDAEKIDLPMKDSYIKEIKTAVFSRHKILNMKKDGSSEEAEC